MHLIVSTHLLGDLPSVLESIRRSPVAPESLVVSCDGLCEDVAQYVQQQRRRFPFPLILVRRAHKGAARRGQVRNNGVRAIRELVKDSDMLYFLDGDICVDGRHFFFLAGRAAYDVVIGRVARLSETDSEKCRDCIRDGRRFRLPFAQRAAFARKKAKAKSTCWVRQMNMPWVRNRIPPYWPDLRSGNFAAKASRFFQVNGFDESMEGWGAEDSDLGSRLYAAGTRVTTFPWRCSAYHLWHPSATQRPAASWLKERLSTSGYRTAHGIECPFEQADAELQIIR